MFEDYKENMTYTIDEYNDQCASDIKWEYFWDITNKEKIEEYELKYNACVAFKSKNFFIIYPLRKIKSYLDLNNDEKRDIDHLLMDVTLEFESKYDNIINWTIQYSLTHNDQFHIMVEPVIG